MHLLVAGISILALPALAASPEATPGAMPESLSAPLQGEAYRKTEEAYSLQKVGDHQGALEAVDGALALAPNHPDLLRLKQEVLLAVGSLDLADALNGELLKKTPSDASLRLFRVYLRQRQGRLAEGSTEAAGIVTLPGISPEIRRQACLVLVDLLQAQEKPVEALAALEVIKDERSVEVLSRKAFLLQALNRPEDACSAFTDALSLEPEGAERRTLLQGLRAAARTAGRSDEEFSVLQQLHVLDPADRQSSLDLAYALLNRKRDPEALKLFQEALAPGSAEGAWLDAAYLAKRLGRNTEAARCFRAALDARKDIGTTGSSSASKIEQDFGIRREVEGLERTWGVVLGTSYRQDTFLPGATSQKILQQGLEVYWQPKALALNGRNVQFFTQAFENLYTDPKGVTGGPTLQGVFGVRAKPFSSQNLVLTAQKMVKLGSGTLDDWMFRAAYSRDKGQDLCPWKDRWTYWSLYTEGASFARTGQYVHQLETRLGESWRLPVNGGRNVLSPYLVLAGDYDSRAVDRTAGGFGLGLTLRRWFRQDAHRAPASWVELTLQERAKLTKATRADGFFVTLTCWF